MRWHESKGTKKCIFSRCPMVYRLKTMISKLWLELMSLCYQALIIYFAQKREIWIFNEYLMSKQEQTKDWLWFLVMSLSSSLFTQTNQGTYVLWPTNYVIKWCKLINKKIVNMHFNIIYSSDGKTITSYKTCENLAHICKKWTPWVSPLF